MPTYRCRKTRKAPAVDGAIDPKVWRLAQPVQLALADSGGPPLQPTEARMLYDDEFLYAAFHCVDSDAWGAFPNRNDPLWLEEVVEVFLDPARRRRCYAEFEVSPLGCAGFPAPDPPYLGRHSGREEQRLPRLGQAPQSISFEYGPLLLLR